MNHKILIIVTYLTFQNLPATFGNGGHHDHSHQPGHHHHADHGDGGEDLEDLIKNFGIAVLGKDQESADDVQPTDDHSHVNIKALINELFHPSSSTTTTTASPVTTSTQRLPIKSHNLGWDLSPIDLVMSNSVLEPVFSPDQQERHSRRLGPEYLTETPYHAPSNDDETRQPLRSGKSVDLNMNLDPEQLIDKPTLPVLDTRRANFLLVNGRRRSKTGRKIKNGKRQKSEKLDRNKHDEDDVLWRETVTHHDNFDHNNSDKKLSDGSQNHHHSDKNCKNHPEDDILWRETVSHQNFITTSPHTFIPDDTTTVTPLSDLSRFLVPPVHRLEDDHHHPEVQRGMIQSALSQVRQDVTVVAEARRAPAHPSNKKGKNVRTRNGSKMKSPGHKIVVDVDNMGPRKNVLDDRRNVGSNIPEQESGGKKSSPGKDTGSAASQKRFFHHKLSATNSPPTATVTRRGKKSDDNNESNHHVHEDLSDDEVEDVIFQHDLLQSHSSFNADQDDNIPLQRFKPKTHSNNKHERKGKNFNKLKHPSSELNSIHNTQDAHIHHNLMMSITRESKSNKDCRDKREGLHADVASGCQRFYMCHENGRSGRFTCPVGTLFSESLGVCDWARRVKC